MKLCFKYALGMVFWLLVLAFANDYRIDNKTTVHEVVYEEK